MIRKQGRRCAELLPRSRPAMPLSLRARANPTGSILPCPTDRPPPPRRVPIPAPSRSPPLRARQPCPITLTVWNFELPAQPSELSLWTLWPPAAGNTTSTLAQAADAQQGHWAGTMRRPTPPPTLTNFGLNRSGLAASYFIGIQCNGSYSSLPSTSQINTATANFPAGLGLDFYLADDCNGCTGDYAPIKTMGANAHAANRSVKTMMTINAVDSNLLGSIDHWGAARFSATVAALPLAGGDVWSYYQLQRWFRQCSGMDGGLSADQRAHAGGVS